MQQLLSIVILLFFSLSLNGQQQINKDSIKKMTHTNPLLCDIQQGICEMPLSAAAGTPALIPASKKPVKIIYFTDPICSSCWGIEPQLRKLKLEYGEYVEIEYHMGGLLPSWDVYNSGGISKPSDVAHHWDEVSAHYDMPIDGDVWLEDPLPSSYPPSIAFKAAQMQDKAKAVLFLRKLRELLFLQKKNVTKWEWVEQAAQVTGLDAVRLKADMEGDAGRLFQEDLALARQLGVRGFPTLFFSDSSGRESKMYGVRPYGDWEQSVLNLHGAAQKKPYDTTWEALFAKYPTLTAKEFSMLSGRDRQEAEAFLNELFQQKKLDRVQTKNGDIWIENKQK